MNANLLIPFLLTFLNLLGAEDIHTDLKLPLTRDTSVKLEDTAISRLVENGKLPNTMDSFRKAMEKYWGPTKTATAPFSDARGETDLDEPRKLYASLSGELFVGNIHRRITGADFEFLSRNSKTGKFDFGVVRNYGQKNEEIMVVGRDACVICHKNGGPIFPVKGWANYLGSNLGVGSKGLFRAFLERLAVNEPRFRPFQQGVEELAKVIYKRNDATSGIPDGEFESAVQTLAAQIGDGATWEGIHLGEELSDRVGFFEKAVVFANQQLVMDAYIHAAKTQGDLESRTKEILDHAIHGTFPTDRKDKYYERFSGFPENRPVILKDQMAETFRKRIPGFDFSKEKFLEYNQKKQSGKFANTLDEFDPTKDSSFLKDSQPIGGRGTQSHADRLFELYTPKISQYFQFSDEASRTPTDRASVLLRERFKTVYSGPLDGGKRHMDAVEKFQKDVSDEFLASPYLQRNIKSGVMPSPSSLESLFYDFVTHAPVSDKSLFRGRAEKEGKTQKKCMDCHKYAPIVRMKYVFTFEMSGRGSRKPVQDHRFTMDRGQRDG